MLDSKTYVLLVYLYLNNLVYSFRNGGVTMVFRKLNLFLAILSGLFISLTTANAQSYDTTTSPSSPKTSFNINQILQSDSQFRSILSENNPFEVQILYTDIIRSKNNNVKFDMSTYKIDSTKYFYPASSVKLPIALLTLNKINDLNSTLKNKITLNSTLEILDSNSNVISRSSFRNLLTTMLVNSSNTSYNSLYDFLGQQYIHDTLKKLSYTNVKIIHRLGNSQTGKISYTNNAVRILNDKETIYNQKKVIKSKKINLNLTDTAKGTGYIDSSGNLINKPMDFSKHNFISVKTLQSLLASIFFSDSIPSKKRFNLTDENIDFLKQCLVGTKDATYKYFLYGGQGAQDSNITMYNKIGQAYGFVVDNAYIVDETTGAEFMLTATAYADSDKIFNDGRYNYKTSLGFLKNLGQAVLDAKNKLLKQNQVPSKPPKDSSTPVTTTSPLLVFIDAGHGGKDPGAHVGDIDEKDLNLKIALKLNKMLQSKGVKTYMIRSDDTYTSNIDKVKLAKDMKADLYLGIHHNSLEKTEYSGTMTLYFDRKESVKNGISSLKFAEALHSDLVNQLKFKDLGLVSRPNLVVFKSSEIPAIISEIGFMTNPDELKKMTSDEYQTKAAVGLYNGILRVLGSAIPDIKNADSTSRQPYIEKTLSASIDNTNKNINSGTTVSPTPNTTVVPDTSNADSLSTSSSNSKLKPLLVFIDPGHGGKDYGSHVSNVTEKKLNIEVAQRLHKLLNDRGVKTYLARSDDTYLTTENKAKLANDMKADLYIAIHHNAIGKPDFSGTMTLYNDNNEIIKNNISSLIFAEAIQSGLVNQLNYKNLGKRIRSDLIELNKPSMPAVRAEIGFMTNADELTKISSEEYQSKAAVGLFDGIIKLLKNK